MNHDDVRRHDDSKLVNLVSQNCWSLRHASQSEFLGFDLIGQMNLPDFPYTILKTSDCDTFLTITKSQQGYKLDNYLILN